MAKEMCRNHPHVFASGQCKHCGIPICDDCKIVSPSGVFCSEQCAERFDAFQSHASAFDAAHKRKRWRFGLGRIAVLGLVVLAIALFLHFAYGVNSLSGLPQALKTIWHDVLKILR